MTVQDVCFVCDSFEASLRLPSLPEMIFDKNMLRIEHEGGFGLEFNAKDALARVDPDHDTIKVANAREWAEARSVIIKWLLVRSWTLFQYTHHVPLFIMFIPEYVFLWMFFNV